MATRSSDDPPFVDSSAALASLYQAPLAEFVARRSALVMQLKRSGHKDVAARIASAGKPSRAAYLVNQVFWRARVVYDGVLEAGTAARAAQQAHLLGDAAPDLAATMQLRDGAVRSAVQVAERVASEEGQAASQAIVAQVRGTFEALAAHGLDARMPHGHLDADVSLPGLGALAGLVLPSTAMPVPVRRFAVVARRAAPEVEPVSPPDPRVVEAATIVETLEQRRAAAVERLEDVRRTSAAAADVADAAERAAADASQAAVKARQAAARAAQSAQSAEEDVARRAAELTEAQARLRELEGPPEPTGTQAPSGKGSRLRAAKPSRRGH